MTTKRVHTKVWMDEWFSSLSRSSKLLFLYCITNDFLGFSGLYECSDRQMMFDTGLTTGELEDSKKELSEKVRFTSGWVYVVNHEKLDPIQGENNPLRKARNKEILLCPEGIRSLLLDPTKPLPSPSIDPTETLQSPYEGARGSRRGSGKIFTEDEGGLGETSALEGSELITRFNLKMKKNYQLTQARKIHIRARLKTFSAEQLETAVDNLAASPWHRGENDRKWSADPDFLFRSDEQVDKFLNQGGDQSSKKEKIFISHLIEEAGHATSF